MLWYIYSILASLSFVGMVLCTRYLGNKGFSSRQILLFLLAFAFIEFLVINNGTLDSILKSEQFWNFLIIMTITGIFTVIGNWADFTATIKAPNPGFAVAIRSSNVLIIAFFSVLIFGSSLSLVKLLGVLFIIGGIAALSIEKKNNSVKQSERKVLRWDVLAIIGALSFTVSALGIKKMSQMDFSSIQINLFIFGFNFFAFLILSHKELKNYFQNTARFKNFLLTAFLAGTFSFIANIFSIKGIYSAPNPGYYESIKNTQILFITLLSVPLFGASLSKQKLFGVVAILIGTMIIII